MSELFIRRPVMTTLVMLGILLFGVLGFARLPINDMPEVDFPTLTVVASLPGASPETMATTVATVLERQFSDIAGIDNITSSSTLGTTSIVLQFSLDRNIDSAAQDVQTAIAAALPLLPPMPTRPLFRKVNPADAPILYLALSSATLPLSAVDEYAETLVAQHLSMVDGVAQVLVFGAQKYAVRVQVSPPALAARQVGLDEVARALQAGSVKQPTGNLDGPEATWSVQANDQLLDAAAFRPLVVAVRHGAPVRLREVARVLDSVENDKVATWTRSGRAIVLAILRQPNTNTVQVIDDLKGRLPGLERQVPPSVSLRVLFDRSTSIRDSVRDVGLTLGVTVALVVLVIFLFLRNPTATVIPSLSLPMSLVGALAAMALFRFSLNNLTLMALTLCVGFVIDDAIVVLENIVRHLERGEDPTTAALRGSREVGFTILSMTLSLVAVFIPILFMAGMLGRIFREFAVTITAAILVSGFVALTLIPMLSSRFLKARRGPQGPAFRFLEALFSHLLGLYDWSLGGVLRFRGLTLAISGLLLVVTAVLLVRIPKGFIPSADTGQLFVTTQAGQDISFDGMVAHQEKVAALVATDPSVEDYVSVVGAGGAANTMNSGRLFLSLKPPGQRRLSADQVLQELRRKFAPLVGIRAFPQNPSSIRLGGMLTSGLYQCTLQGLDLETLYSAAQAFLEEVRRVPGVEDPNLDLQTRGLQALVQVDRDQASALGLTARQVDEALEDAYGARQVGQIYTDTNEYQVLLQVAPEFQEEPERLQGLYVRSNRGPLVPLSAVARYDTGVAPSVVEHLGQLPSATISFNLGREASLGVVVEQVLARARRTLPAGVTASFQGQAQAFQSSLSSLAWLLVVSILVIYIVLGILYESFAHPLTILSGLPSAGLGALVTLELFHLQLDLYAFLGLLMLIGIVKKNAIMLIDHALEVERASGKTPLQSIREACRVRFRPIMMTTAAALAGSLPIALGLGAGGEARRPLGMAVVGGLLLSQSLTLYLTPVVYCYVEEASRWLGRRRGGPP